MVWTYHFIFIFKENLEKKIMENSMKRLILFFFITKLSYLLLEDNDICYHF